jgi:hypothetical protein
MTVLNDDDFDMVRLGHDAIFYFLLSQNPKQRPVVYQD